MQKYLKLGKYKLEISKRTHVMGILNLSPDSFFKGSSYPDIANAVAHAREMAEQGADIIDVGGESTRPGAESISVDEELTRVIPVIMEISRKTNVPISIDSYKPEVAGKAIKAGASMINDINGLRTPGMAEVAAKYNLPVCIMHMQGTPKNMQQNPTYANVVKYIKKFLKKQAEYAVKKGVIKENILIDPGIGFGKTVEHNVEIIQRLKEFKKLGYPLMIGPSRKAFIGKILDAPVEERLAGTIAASVICTINGADILRVHDVKEIKQAVKLTEAIIN